MKLIFSYIRHFIKETSFVIPIILLVVSFVSAFFEYDIYTYILLGNLGGYSLLTNLSFIGIYTLNKKYCYLTRVAPLGLIVLNIIDIIGFYLDEHFYNFTYVVVSTSLFLSIGLFLDLRKRLFI